LCGDVLILASHPGFNVSTHDRMIETTHLLFALFQNLIEPGTGEDQRKVVSFLVGFPSMCNCHSVEWLRRRDSDWPDRRTNSRQERSMSYVRHVVTSLHTIHYTPNEYHLVSSHSKPSDQNAKHPISQNIPDLQSKPILVKKEQTSATVLRQPPNHLHDPFKQDIPHQLIQTTMASLRVPFDEVLTFPDGTSFQRLEAITDFRQCHGVTPPERRILYRCRRVSPAEGKASSSKPAVNGNDNNDNKNEEDGEKSEEFILKIKVQIHEEPSTTIATNNSPSSSTTQIPPPSTPTSHELRALTIFRDSQTPCAPHLTAFSHTPQPNSANSPLPQTGYISSTVMSKISGKSLFELGYWSLADEEREEIQRGFLEALR